MILLYCAALVAPGAFPLRQPNGEWAKKKKSGGKKKITQHLSKAGRGGERGPALRGNGIFRPRSEIKALSGAFRDGHFIAHLGEGNGRNNLLLF